jgi:hypothetical protein
MKSLDNRTILEIWEREGHKCSRCGNKIKTAIRKKYFVEEAGEIKIVCPACKI